MSNLDKQMENNLGAKLLKRFKVEDTKEIDFGEGCIVKLKVPKTYSEYTQLLEQAKERFIESKGEDGDPNYIYVYLLEGAVQNLNAKEIEDIVFNAPGVTDLLIKAIDQASGNVITRLEAEAVEASKKKSKKIAGGS